MLHHQTTRRKKKLEKWALSNEKVQAVEEKEMPAKKTEGSSLKWEIQLKIEAENGIFENWRSKWGEEPVTLVPNIKSVSSTAMVMQVRLS